MKSLLASLVLFSLVGNSAADTIDLGVQVPLGEKIVEIHMFRTDPIVEQPTKKRKATKVDILPFSEGICSGAFISPTGDILTARHCVENVDSFVVTTYDQQHYVATLIYVSPTHDLAMLHIDQISTPFFELAHAVSQGETVMTYGSPLGITGTISMGIVAKLDGDITLIDCSVLPGNSGCPLINTRGQLIGTVTAGYMVGMGTTHLNIAQSISVVSFFLFDAFRVLAARRN